jgi:transposase, IS5 family
VDPHSEN